MCKFSEAFCGRSCAREGGHFVELLGMKATRAGVHPFGPFGFLPHFGALNFWSARVALPLASSGSKDMFPSSLIPFGGSMVIAKAVIGN